MASTRSGERRQGRASQSQQILVERDLQLGALADALSEARAGTGRIVLIEAPPGRGKSRLLHAAGDMARQAGMRVLGAYGSELEQAFAFGVTMQLFEPLWFSASEAERTALVQGQAQRACQLLTGSLPEPEGAAHQQTYSIIHGLFWLCCNLTALGAGGPVPQPTAMLVDDATWADAASLRFLAYLAQRIESLPLAVVMTVRAGDRTADDGAMSAIRSADATVLMRPPALSSQGVAQIVHSRFPDSDPAFCEASARVTGGNPFLVIELLEQVRSEGIGADAGGAGEIAHLLPESVLTSVADRLGRLSEQARRVASALAVMGDGASVRQIAELAGRDPTATDRGADELAAAHFLHPGTQLTFVHPLVREAVRQAIAPLDRARAHRRAADILAEDHAPRELIAAHLLAAPAGSDPDAIHILRDAAHSALSKGAAEDAVRLLERAVAEHPDPEVYPDLLSELAEAEAAAGLPRAVNRLEHAISVTRERPKRNRLALTQGRALIDSGRHREAAEVLGSARTEVSDADPELADELDAAYVAAAYVVPDLAEEAARLAARVTERLQGQPLSPARRQILAHTAGQAAIAGEPRAQVLELVELAWDDGALLESDPAWERSAMLVTTALLHADELERCLELCERAMAVAARRGSPTAFGVASVLRAWPRCLQGRVADAALDAEAALDVRQDRWEAYARSAHSVVAATSIQRGRFEEAATALSLLDHPGAMDSLTAPVLLDLRSQLRLAQRRAGEALADALEAGRRVQDTVGDVSPGVIPWRSSAALAQLALGELEAAWELAAEELALARRAGVTRVIMRDLRVHGLVLRGREGIDRLTEAAALGESYPRRLEHIEVLVELGAALRRANRRAAAREPLKQALDLATEGGMELLAGRARTELLASGARAGRAMLSGVEALTPSQRRVAELATQGLTTRMIAETLFITPKTVEFHLRQIYQKLEVRSRAEMAAALNAAAPPEAAAGGSAGQPG